MNHCLQILSIGGQVDRFCVQGFTDDELLDYIIVPRQQMGCEVDAISPDEFEKLRSRDLILCVVDNKGNPIGKNIIHYPYYFVTQEDIDNWEMLVTDTKEAKISLNHLKDY